MRRRDAILGAVALATTAALVASQWDSLGTARPTPAPSASASSSANGAVDPAASSGGAADPLASLHLDATPIDWSRPIAPAVAAPDGYVGAAACAVCHRDVAHTFAGHSMAHTGLRRIAGRTAELDALFDGTHVVRHPGSGFAYRPRREGPRYLVEESLDGPDGKPIHTWSQPITHTFTSGTFGAAFGFEQGGRVYQVPIDWYPQAHAWGLDPGYKRNARFTRPFAATCIGCHSEVPQHLGGNPAWVDLARLPEGVGCERCHGPGARHAASSKPEDIVDPAHLPWQRQLDVCAQCHLQGTAEVLRAGKGIYDARPGERLDRWSVHFVEAEARPDWFQLTSASERLVRSACFAKSPGKLVCTTCHQAHVSTHAEPAARWRDTCLGCHAEHGCTAPMADRAARGDACPSCHMRKDTPNDFRMQVSGIAMPVTDHWIRRRLSPPTPIEATEKPIRLERVVPFSRLLGEPPEGADLPAIELVGLDASGLGATAMQRAPEAIAGPPIRELFELLGDVFVGRMRQARAPEERTALTLEIRRARAGVVRLAPDDVDALVEYARALYETGEPADGPEPRAALERALRIAPDDPGALSELGGALLRAGHDGEAAPYFERAARSGPDALEAHAALGVFARDAGDLAGAVRHFEDARRVDPRDRWVLGQLAALYARRADAKGTADVAHALAALPALSASTPLVTRANRWLRPGQR